MKKTAIVTLFHGNYNYGGVLQAYALQNCLLEMGVESDVLRMDRKNSAGFRRGQEKEKPKGSLPHTIYVKLCSYLKNLLLARRKKAYDRFMRDAFSASDTVYTDANLHEANDRYDCFITGSDQVWNPNFSSDSTFLKFVDDRHRKISYAASIGVDSVEEEFLQYMVPLVDRLDAVSVREPSAVTILTGRVHKDVCCVLDPTLLLSKEKWEELCQPGKRKNDYIFVYLLGMSEQNYRMVQSVAKTLHLRVVMIPFGTMWLHREVLLLHGKWALSASPVDFLTLLHDARYVITDSFHGAVFSLLFHKDFCALERKNGNKSSRLNARLSDLLGTVGLEERLQRDAAGAAKVLQKEIDFEPVDARLAEKIEYSKGFLRRALELERTQ